MAAWRGGAVGQLEHLLERRRVVEHRHDQSPPMMTPSPVVAPDPPWAMASAHVAVVDRAPSPVAAHCLQAVTLHPQWTPQQATAEAAAEAAGKSARAGTSLVVVVCWPLTSRRAHEAMP